MFFGSIFSFIFILLVAGGGLAYAATQPGGISAYARGSARHYVIRGTIFLVVFAAINIYYRTKAGI